MTPRVAHPTAVSNVLFTTDFSEASTRAYPYALGIARQHGATLHIAHIVTPRTVPLASGSNVLDRARRNLTAFIQPELLEGTKCHTELREGPLWECLSALIADRRIDLIVLGTKGPTGLKRLVLGSDAEEIFRQAPCPVLTIGPRAKPKSENHFKEVLFTTDFSRVSVEALPYAVSYAAAARGHVVVLHVALPTGKQFGCPDLADTEEKLTALIGEELDELATSNCGRLHRFPEIIVDCGDPLTLILKSACRMAADLIVMGVHHVSRSATHLPWGVTREVVCSAPCPVLTIRS